MARKCAFFGLMLAVALIFSYAEAIIPFGLAIPGVKLGLANIVILLVLYIKNFKIAFFINILRIVIIGISFGNFASFMLSLTGGVLAIISMVLFKKLKFSIISVSAVSAVMHNVGQIIVARFITATPSVFYYLPVLIAAGAVAGILTGICAKYTLKILNGRRLF